MTNHRRLLASERAEGRRIQGSGYFVGLCVLEAAELAAAHGKFWEMHEALAEHSYAERVREDFMSGVGSGVNGTPTFFINGVRHDGSYDFDTMMAEVAAAAG